MSYFRKTAIASIIIASTVSITLAADEALDITTVTCADLLSVGDPQVGVSSILLAYGTAAGLANAEIHSSGSIEDGIIKTAETCKANPEMLLIDTFKFKIPE